MLNHNKLSKDIANIILEHVINESMPGREVIENLYERIKPCGKDGHDIYYALKDMEDWCRGGRRTPREKQSKIDELYFRVNPCKRCGHDFYYALKELADTI